MSQKTTARQRTFATAWGIAFDANTSRDELSAEIDRAIAKQDKRATREQLRLVRQCGLDVKKGATRKDAKNKLWEFQCSVAWVLSVLRHHVGARWQHYHDSDLEGDDIHRIARELLDDASLEEAIEEHTPTDAVTGDMWYRIRKASPNMAAYVAVVTKAEACMAAALEKARKRAEQASKTAPAGASKRSGCAVALLVVAIVVGTALALRVIRVGRPGPPRRGQRATRDSLGRVCCASVTASNGSGDHKSICYRSAT